MVRIRRRLLAALGAVIVVTGLALVPSGAAQAAGACGTRYGSSWDNGPYSYAGVPASNAQGHMMVLDAASPYPTSPPGTVHMWTWNNTQNQVWCLLRHDFPADGSHAWQVRNYYTGLCLDVQVDSPINDGDPVWLWSCKTYGNDATYKSQLWDINSQGKVSVPGGSATAYYFQHDDSPECLDVKDQSTADGAALQTWSCKYGGNQLFY